MGRQNHPGRLQRFLEETDATVIRAMRKVGHEQLTPQERDALDAWLQPRIWALATRFAQENDRSRREV